MLDVDVPYSDAWWLKRMLLKYGERPPRVAGRLGDSRRCEFSRREWLDMLWARLMGDTPLLNVNDKWTDATKEFMRLSRTNYAATVVGAVQDRTRFLGARTGAAGGNDADGDETVRRFMDENGVFFTDALTFAYGLGTGYVLVGPPRPGEETAVATAEDPRNVVAILDPLDPLRVRTAAKTYRDDEAGEDVVHLYLSPSPDAVLGSPESKYRVRVARRSIGNAWTGNSFRSTDWVWDDSPKVSGPFEHQQLGLPIVPVVNKWGQSEFEGATLDLLDRIHNGIADRLWVQKYQAFLQRAAKGDFPRTDPKTGDPIDYDAIFAADPGALWLMPKGTDLWESRQVDLAGILNAGRADLLELSATTNTPMFMFIPDATGGSAEGADVVREGSVNKARDRVHRLDPAARRITRLGLAYSGKPDVAAGVVKTIWAPVREFTLQQRGAAAVQGKTSGVPQRSILSELWQFDPETVARMEVERDADLLYATPAPTPSPAPTVTP